MPILLGYHTHTFNGPFSGTTQVSRYQKGKTNLDFTEARDSEWQWHQLGHMQVCILLQTDNHTSTPPLCFFTGRMPFLPPNQQRQRTEGKTVRNKRICYVMLLPLHPFNGHLSRTTWESRYHKGKNQSGFKWDEIMGFWNAVALAGRCANNVHLAPDRQPHQQAGCSSWRVTNSVKAMRANC